MAHDRNKSDLRAKELDALTGASGGRGNSEDVNVLRAAVHELLLERSALIRELLPMKDVSEKVAALTEEVSSLQRQLRETRSSSSSVNVATKDSVPVVITPEE